MSNRTAPAQTANLSAKAQRFWLRHGETLTSGRLVDVYHRSSNAPQVSNRTAPAHLTCAKCNGKGRLPWTRQDNGVCYWCSGSGKVRVQNHNALRAKISGLINTSWICIEAEIGGYTKRRDSYLRMMLDDMFIIGTDAAREVLAQIRSGQWHDEVNGTGYLTEQCGSKVANAVADRLIEMGRERKAAETEAAAA